MICPNKSDSNWKDLSDTFGEFNAYKIWKMNDNDIPVLYRGALMLYLSDNPEEAIPVLEQYQDVTGTFVFAKENSLKNIIGNINTTVFADEKFLSWAETKGYLPKLGLDRVFKDGKYTSDSKFFSDILHRSAPITNLESVDIDTEEEKNTAGRKMISGIADRLSEVLSVPYEFITAEEAKTTTEKANIPWNGEAAFFLGGNVYFVGDNITVDTVFHEFSHPFMRGIAKENPSLFEKLYTDLSHTPEGQDIILKTKQLYPELDPAEDLFKEEALVRSLQHRMKEKLVDQRPSGKFSEFVSNLLYQIKQQIRRVFGKKVKIENLKYDTKLDELVDMLNNEEFKFEPDSVTDQDVASYIRETKDYTKDLKNLDQSQIVAQVNRFYDTLIAHIDKVVNNKNYSEMKKILADDSKRGDLFEMKKTLESYQTLTNRSIQVKDEILHEQKRAEALVLSTLRLGDMVSRIKDHLLELKKDPSKDNLYRASYYQYLLNSWDKFIKESLSDLGKSGVSESSPIYKELSTTADKIKNSKNIVESIFEPVLVDVLWSQNEVLAKNIEAEHKTRMEKLISKGVPQSIIDKEIADYAKLKLDKEKIQSLIKGKLGDANFLNSYLEGYLSNNDPVISGFASFIKDNKTQAEIRSQKKLNDMLLELEPLLKAAGYNASNFRDLNKNLVFKDKVGYIDNDGKLVEKETWTYLNSFKNYRFDRDRLKHEQRTASEKNDKDAYKKATMELDDLEEKWFHRKYTDAFYEKFKLFEQSEEGQEVYLEREALFNAVNEIKMHTADESELLDAQDEIKAIWDQYRQMASLTDLDGNKKTGRELKKAEILRAYKDQSREQYNWIERPGAFEAAYYAFEQQQYSLGLRDEQLEEAKRKWKVKNTRTVLKPDFYKTRAKILDTIRRIREKLNQTGIEVDEKWGIILAATSSYRDNDGQPMASDMSEGLITTIKQAQEDIIAMESTLNTLTGLTAMENAEINEIYHKIKNKMQLTDDERSRLSELMDKKDKLGISKIEKAELLKAYNELRELQYREATDYYLDVINNWLTKANKQILDKETADPFLRSTDLNDMLKDDAFREWFEKNHIKREKFNPDSGNTEQLWERLYVWNIIRPSDTEYFETTTLSTGEKIMGLPTLDYFSQFVKPEFITKRVIGETIDNEGNFLPKLIPSSPYVNQDYLTLKQTKPDLYNLLEAMKKHHLAAQKGVGKYSKLYLDIARFRKSTLEHVQTGKVQTWLSDMWAYMRKSGDEYEQGLNYDQTFTLVNADIMDNEIASIPVRGKYDIPVDEVSLDLIAGTARYMHSTEMQKQLIEISPMAQALKQVITNHEENGVKDMKKVNRFNFIHRGELNYLNKKGRSVRERAVENLIERELFGKNITGVGSDSVWFNKWNNFLMKRASISFFALNIPSAIVNRWSAQFQTMISAAAGQYLNLKDYAKGRRWSLTAASDMSYQIYNKGPKSLKQQTIEIFDPVQGRFEEGFGEGPSRSIAKDAFSMTWTMAPRKWMEIEANLQLFAGMLYHQKVEQKIGDTVKQIDYIDAWELKDGQIQLKPGVDPEWGTDGEKFRAYRAKMHEASNQLNGSFGKFDQPEANRYLLYRYVMFLKKWFTSMFMSRFAFNTSTGGRRYNIALGEATEGRYVTMMRIAAKTAKSYGKYIHALTPYEKRALLANSAEMVIISLIPTILSLIFDWDPDDEDRYQKLRDKQKDPITGEFSYGGWFSNHLLYTGLKLRAEWESMIPLPGYGTDDLLNMFDFEGIAKSATLDNYGRMLEDVYNVTLGNENKAYYQREVGPYAWQSEGSFKLWNRIGNSFGLTGNTIDPVKEIKGFESSKNLNR